MSKDLKREPISEYVAKKEAEVEKDSNVKEPDVLVKTNIKRVKYSCNAHTFASPVAPVKVFYKPGNAIEVVGEDDNWYELKDGSFVLKSFIGD